MITLMPTLTLYIQVIILLFKFQLLIIIICYLNCIMRIFFLLEDRGMSLPTEARGADGEDDQLHQPSSGHSEKPHFTIGIPTKTTGNDAQLDSNAVNRTRSRYHNVWKCLTDPKWGECLRVYPEGGGHVEGEMSYDPDNGIESSCVIL